MKKKTVFFTLVSLLLFALPGCTAEPKSTNINVVDYNPNRNIPRLYDYPNQPDGFNSLPWYISLEEAEQIKQVKFELKFELSPGRETYIIPEQGVEIFGVYFPVVGYNFKQNKLVSVNIQFIKDPNQEAYQKLLEQMTVTYGKPPEIKRFADGDILIWPGTETCMTLSHSSTTQNTNISFRSSEIAYFFTSAEELLKDKKQKEKRK